MNVRQAMTAFGLVFVVALAVVVAQEMSTEAMAVVIGVVCGVAAGIPTSVLLLVALTRHDGRRLVEADRRARPGEHNSPPVVIIQGGTPQALPPGQQGTCWPAPMPGPPLKRDFYMVGGDELLLDEEDF
jgi:hypothetical protein